MGPQPNSRNGGLALAGLAIIVAVISYHNPALGDLFTLLWTALQLPAEGPIGMLPVIGQQIQMMTGWVRKLLIAIYSGMSVMIIGGLALGVYWWRS